MDLAIKNVKTGTKNNFWNFVRTFWENLAKIGFKNFTVMTGKVKGKKPCLDYIHVPMAVHAVDDGYSDVLCGNGNICGRNTTGPGICCKFDFTVVSREYEGKSNRDMLQQICNRGHFYTVFAVFQRCTQQYLLVCHLWKNNSAIFSVDCFSETWH